MVTVLRLSKLLSCWEFRNRGQFNIIERKRATPFETITYNLKENGTSSDHFYHTLRETATIVLNTITNNSEEILHQYAYFLEEDCHEQKRSPGEYAIEFLTIGITWRCYSTAVQNTPAAILPLLNYLYAIRNKYRYIKKHIDAIRGKITQTFVVPHLKIKSNTGQTILNGNNFRKLTTWLTATGEFKDEVKRFTRWQQFFSIITGVEENKYLSKATDLADWFYHFSKDRLGSFTEQVSPFLKNNLASHRGKEDALFCGKSEVEYHVNMIASEIMNQGLRADFLQTKEKTVLVPGCMRSHPENTCKAVQHGDDITCTHCTKSCNVNRITALGEQNGFKTFIVPHSSGFTKWLKRFSDQNENGIVAVACTLNIVAGGYEMRELNIPSQCVLLDYCGCKKHWHEEGFATDVNDAQLLKVLNS